MKSRFVLVWARHCARNCCKVAVFICGMLSLEIMLQSSMFEVKENSNLPRERSWESDLLETSEEMRSSKDKLLSAESRCNCMTAIGGNMSEIIQGESFQASHRKEIIKRHTREILSAMNGTCSSFLHDRRYRLEPASVAESDFPLAFSIVMYDNPRQAERLLRAIYRPQNYYCFHVDRKASKTTALFMRKLVRCFKNVFLVNRSVDVRWGTFSVLEADLNCMKDLLSKPGWKYFINLTGKEFPLKTNLELVEILKIYNGSNEVNAKISRQTHMDKMRYKFKRDMKTGHNTSVIKSPPPFNLTLVKGSVHVTLNREFVHFVITDGRVPKFLNWAKDTYVPDELVFSTINYNPQVFHLPGSYTGKNPETHPINKPFLSRHKEWLEQNITCHGKFVRHICIYGLRDLPRLRHKPHFFVNKLEDTYQPLAYDCLEEFISARVDKEYLTNSAQIDRDFYAKQPAVRFHL